MSGTYGATIKPKEPVKQCGTEGPLDQSLAVEVDEAMDRFVFLESVRNATDVFERCPVVDGLDLDKSVDGNSLTDLLAADEYLREDLYVDPVDGKAQPIANAAVDRYAVSDAAWIDHEEELIWKSALLAQLKAKHVAITHLLNDPGAVDFGSSLSEGQRAAVARRARELAAQLKDAALAEICATTRDADERFRAGARDTARRFQKYAVTRKEEIDAGGLTEPALTTLFPEEE
jgi:hypothetical protein